MQLASWYKACLQNGYSIGDGSHTYSLRKFTKCFEKLKKHWRSAWLDAQILSQEKPAAQKPSNIGDYSKPTFNNAHNFKPRE